MNKKKKYPKLILLMTILMVAVISFGGFYSYWNYASPEQTCASCHEIRGSVHSFAQSSHRELHCKECHGTALSNGIHSLKEKGKMILNHVGDRIPETIRMNEEQMLAIMSDCKRCHSSEFANWEKGGHSATYEAIFLDEKHNKDEQLNFDCLRCHGMFYDGATPDLVEPVNKEGPWVLLDSKKTKDPTIPCMACHKIHTEGGTTIKPDYANPDSIFYAQSSNEINLSFYDRHEKMHIPSTMLPKLQLFEEGNSVDVSNDYIMRNCVQCHAPNGWHEAGTSDDRTPRGVHKGLSCSACHEPHSNSAKNSCSQCHPAFSNCKIDVTIMNTTYAYSKSPNNIHWVSCEDCHNGNRTIIKSNR